MLSTTATAKTSDGTSRVNPADLPRAVAHTASSTPDTTSTAHAIGISSGAVLSHTGYGTARPGAGGAARLHLLRRGRSRGPGGRSDRSPGRELRRGGGSCGDLRGHLRLVLQRQVPQGGLQLGQAGPLRHRDPEGRLDGDAVI